MKNKGLAPKFRSELKRLIRRYGLAPSQRLLAHLNGESYTPEPGNVRFGDLRRLSPISSNWGWDRGRPVDRYYIEGFLERNVGNIQGSVLEIEDDAYTKRFGGSRVTSSDILDISPENSLATIVADLTDAEHLPADTYDCAIITQTLHLIYDVKAALKTLQRVIKPGGVALITIPGISEVDDNTNWLFTTTSVRRLLEATFEDAQIAVESHGNVLAAIAFLTGLAIGELRTEELDHHDPDYPVTIAAHVRKAASTSS